MSKFLFVLLFSLPFLAQAQTAYTVRRGDTLLKIADRLIAASPEKKTLTRYELAKTIQQLNPQIKDPRALEPGDNLTLPSWETPVTTTTTTTTTTTVTTTTLPAPVEVSHETAPPVAPAVVAESHSEEPAHESSHSNFIIAQLRYNILELKVIRDATKSATTFNSDLSAGLDLQYGWVLSDSFHLLFQAGYTRTNFQNLPDGKTVDHKSESLMSYGLGAAYELGHDVHLDVMAILADRAFIIPTSDTTFEMKHPAIPGAEMNLSWDYYSSGSYLLGVSVIGEYIAGLTKDSIEYKTSLEPLGALYWKSKNAQGLNYKAQLLYKQGHQETSESEQKENLTSLGLALIF